MKSKISILLIALAGLFSLSSFSLNQPAGPGQYTVEGVADAALNGKKVFLYDYNTRKALDSTMVEDSKFTFKGSTDEIKFCMITVERSAVGLILEAGNITADLKERATSGTTLNDALTAYNKEILEMNKARNNLYKDLKEKIADEAEMRKEFENAYKNEWIPKYKALLNKSLDANANNIVAAAVLNEMAMSYDIAEMDAAFAKVSKDVTSLAMITRLIDRNNSLKKTAEGQKFTDFTIDQPGGVKASFSDYVGKGKYVLVDFWASWCGPCRAEIPNLKELYEKYKGDKFEILGVAVWDKLTDSQKAVEKEGMVWPHILDCQEIPTKIYGINGIPQIMLIGPDGTIVARNLRGDAMKAKVAEVMAQ